MSNTMINCDIRLRRIVEYLLLNGADVECSSDDEVHMRINDSYYIISVLSFPIVTIMKKISVAEETPKSVQQSVQAINDQSICVKAEYDIVSSTVTLSSTVFSWATNTPMTVIFPYLSSIENAEAVMTGMIRQNKIGAA